MEILNKAQQEYNENFSFLKTLNLQSEHLVEQKLFSIHDEVFSQTDCLECANCCKTCPPIITTDDITRISKYLKISKKQFKRKYILEDIDGSLSLNSVPCHFLQADNKCSIYDIRPEACRNYPHSRQRGFSARAKLNAKNTLICPAMYKIVKRLMTDLSDFTKA